MILIEGGPMLAKLKFQILSKDIRQYRMAVDLGWDPTKLSRIIHETVEPTAEERRAIAEYVDLAESEIFSGDQATLDSNSDVISQAGQETVQAT
jgi:hypothetical protein